MTPEEVARSYDAIAERWTRADFPARNGIRLHECALRFLREVHPQGGRALDVGCGANGRIDALLLAAGLDVLGIDISERMLDLARERQPAARYEQADVRTWSAVHGFEFVTAWDSAWHVPLVDQDAVMRKLFGLLVPGGVCVFSAGGLDGPGEVRDAAMGVPMYHATLGMPRLHALVGECGCVFRHLEYDDPPSPHLAVVLQKLREDVRGA